MPKSIHVTALPDEHCLVQALTFTVEEKYLPLHWVHITPTDSQYIAVILKDLEATKIRFNLEDGIFKFAFATKELLVLRLKELLKRNLFTETFLARALARYPMVVEEQPLDLQSLSIFNVARQPINHVQKNMISHAIAHIFAEIAQLNRQDAQFVFLMLQAGNLTNENAQKLAQLSMDDCVKQIHAIFENPAPHLSIEQGGLFNLEPYNGQNTKITADAVYTEVRCIIQAQAEQLSKRKFSARV